MLDSMIACQKQCSFRLHPDLTLNFTGRIVDVK